MKKILLSILAVIALMFTSCSENEAPTNKVTTPATYTFEVDGQSTVSFSGQVARLKMAGELKSALNTNTKTLAELTVMFKDGMGFEDASLNTSGKKLRSTVASATFSDVSTAEAESIRNSMDAWISDFTMNVQPNWVVDASAGVPGRLAYDKDGATAYRYVNAKGLEINQAVAKTIIGSVFADQIVNKYVSEAFINENIAAHEAGNPYKGNPDNKYTKLQHGWDEAYGYVFGMETDKTTPDATLRAGFLNSYLKSLNNDDDFSGILNEIFNAFKLGRAAINAKEYSIVKEQAAIIRNVVSKVIAVRAVYYLQNSKGTKDTSKLHALSEGYGFVQSLRYVLSKNGSQIQQNVVSEMITTLEANNGLWSVTDVELDAMSTTIATYFDFTVAQAAN